MKRGPGQHRYSSGASALVAVLAGLCTLGGCETPPRTARVEATQRWNAARAQVKAKLAADQFGAGNVAAAAAELDEAYKLDPTNPELTALRARVWLAEGRLAQAETLLAQTHLEDRPQAEIEYLKGVVLQEQQRWDDALAAFLKAGELNEDEVAYVVAAAQAWLQLGQPDRALGLLTARAAKFNWTGAYQAALAECHEQCGDWSAAASAWQQMVAAHPADTGFRERRAIALYRSRRYGEAIGVLSDLVAAGSGESSGVLRLMLAECHLAEGRTAAAREQVQAVLQNEPGNVPALHLLACCLGMAGEYGAATRVAQRALAVDAGNIATLELTVALAWRAGDRELAHSTATRLLERDGQNAVAHQVLHPD